MNSPADVWQKVLSLMGQEMTSVTLNTWFDDTEVVSLDGARLVLYSPQDFKGNTIRSRYVPAVQKALRELFSFDFEVEVLDTAGLERYRAAAGPESEQLSFSDQYTFESFVVGSTNKFAYNAALAVAEDRGLNYNPLFIYGQSGLGKTHLLYAIANKTRAAHPEHKILYIKSEDFVNELIGNLRRGADMQEFRNKYRSADLFLMDDVQFLAGKDTSEEELFHTFNALHESNKKIVFTSDRPPQEMLRMEERLKTRFEWGLPVDIQPPDYETRVAIIKNKAISRGISVPDAVLNYVAENITANVRQIEGVVNKILALQELMGERVDVDTTIRAVRDILRDTSNYLPSADVIIQEVARFYELDSETIRGQSQSKEVTTARNVAMYIIREMTKLSLNDIGQEFGGRHHSTVLNSINRVEKMRKEQPEFSEIVRDITTAVNGATV